MTQEHQFGEESHGSLPKKLFEVETPDGSINAFLTPTTEGIATSVNIRTEKEYKNDYPYDAPRIAEGAVQVLIPGNVSQRMEESIRAGKQFTATSEENIRRLSINPTEDGGVTFHYDNPQTGNKSELTLGPKDVNQLIEDLNK